MCVDHTMSCVHNVSEVGALYFNLGYFSGGREDKSSFG